MIPLFRSNLPKKKKKSNLFAASNAQQDRWKNMPPRQKKFNRLLLPDRDGDKVPDFFDCRPFNPEMHRGNPRPSVTGRDRKRKVSGHYQRLLDLRLEKLKQEGDEERLKKELINKAERERRKRRIEEPNIIRRNYQPIYYEKLKEEEEKKEIETQKVKSSMDKFWADKEKTEENYFEELTLEDFDEIVEEEK